MINADNAFHQHWAKIGIERAQRATEPWAVLRRYKLANLDEVIRFDRNGVRV